MDITEFKKVLKEIEYALTANSRRTIDSAINEEKSKGNIVSIAKVLKVLKKYEQITENELKELENQKIAVCYTGKPEITITYILDSIIHNNNVTLCISENKIINEVLIKIVVDIIRNSRITNNWINYNMNYNELYLRDNERIFDKIVYVGDYYEYLKLKSFLKTNVEYNNYGYVKLYIDKTKFAAEYGLITKFAYRENIFLETYTDVEDFISESKEEDYAVIFAEMNVVNQIKRQLRSGEMLINAFPFDSYEFKINR